MLIIQACRGNESNKEVDTPEAPYYGRGGLKAAVGAILSTRGGTIGQLSPNQCDYLIIRSALPQMHSVRNEATGSYLITYLCDALKKFSNQSFMDVITYVNYELSQKKINLGKYNERLVCEIISSLRKKIILHSNIPDSYSNCV